MRDTLKLLLLGQMEKKTLLKLMNSIKHWKLNKIINVFMKKFFFIIFTIFLVFSYNPSLEAQERNYYQELVNEWSKIFPDRNRNAAGR